MEIELLEEPTYCQVSDNKKLGGRRKHEFYYRCITPNKDNSNELHTTGEWKKLIDQGHYFQTSLGDTSKINVMNENGKVELELVREI